MRMSSFGTFSIVVVSIVALLAALFVLFKFLTARTYRPTADQVASILDAVLASKVTYQAWDKFICVPIRHNADLERIRLACVALEEDCYLEMSGGQGRGDAGFNAMGLARIRDIRGSLTTRDAERAGSPAS